MTNALERSRAEIEQRPEYRAAVAALAQTLGRETDDVMAEAGLALTEMRSTHSSKLVSAWTNACQFFVRGYSEIRCDPAQIDQLRELCARQTVVFLPSHRSNLDGPVLSLMRREQGLPPVMLFGGINMAFFPFGDLMRRLGTIYIRRSFQNDPVYKLALREYVAYLVRGKQHLEWYIEGTRTRTGKLRPPKLGLLAYVADALAAEPSGEVALVPVSIVYDHLFEIDDIVAENQGRVKQAENVAWAVRSLRALNRPSGKVHVGFGEPVQLRAVLDDAESEDQRRLSLTKAALEVSVRINRVTPITPLALLALTMLGSRDVALTVEEAAAAVADRMEGVRQRGFPMTDDSSLTTERGVAEALSKLVDRGIITAYADGPDPVYLIAGDQRPAAAYYRNSIVHFFVTPAIAELALLACADDTDTAREDGLVSEALRLRDLFKFEFFFPERAQFIAELEAELAARDADWRTTLAGGSDHVRLLMRTSGPLWAHLVVRPFLEAYSVTASQLTHSSQTKIDVKATIKRSLALGHQMLLQRRIIGPESISAEQFRTCLDLAGHRGLLDGIPGEVRRKRETFANEINDTIAVSNEIEMLSRVRQRSPHSKDSGHHVPSAAKAARAPHESAAEVG
jgi:glycerol-3-phosphate O-acyltransferase